MKIMLRLFTCIWIPEDVKDKIVDFQKKVMDLPLKAKFVEKENLHLTVVFLGDIEESKVDWIKDVLDKSAKEFKKFDVSLTGLKIIPNINYIKVFGINVDDKEGKLPKIIKRVGSITGGSYYEESKLTLCRVKNISDKGTVMKFIEDNRDVEIGVVPVDYIALVKSTLTKRGPIYETIHKAELI